MNKNCADCKQDVPEIGGFLDPAGTEWICIACAFSRLAKQARKILAALPGDTPAS